MANVFVDNAECALSVSRHTLPGNQTLGYVSVMDFGRQVGWGPFPVYLGRVFRGKPLPQDDPLWNNRGDLLFRGC